MVCGRVFYVVVFFFFFFKQKTAYDMLRSLVGSEMCIRDSFITAGVDKPGHMVGNSDCIRAKAITSLMSFSLWWPIPDGTLKMEWFSLSDF